MRFEKQTFTGEVTLDYNQFVDCEFKDCIIHYHGGDFSVTNVKFTNVRYLLKGAAHTTLSFLKLMGTVSPKLLEDFLASTPPATVQAPTLN